MTDEISLQDQLFPSLACFGCGPANAKGLQLKSHRADDELVVARFTPWPEHDNGVGFLNGGIIGTLLDCHGAAAVISEAARREWVLPGENGEIGLQYVTAGLDVRYLRPTPLHESLDLRAWLEQASEDEMEVHAEIRWEDKPRATGRAVWKRWRPRS